MSECEYPLFATYGGGRARATRCGDVIFIVAPQCPDQDLSVGDDVPYDWGLEPINEEGRLYLESLFADEEEQ